MASLSPIKRQGPLSKTYKGFGNETNVIAEKQADDHPFDGVDTGSGSRKILGPEIVIP